MSNEQQSGKMWSGRFREPLNPRFESWQRSLPYDWPLLPYEIAASKAHAHMIAAAGVLSPAELAAIVRGLDAILPRTAKRAAALYTEEYRKATSAPGMGSVMSMAPGVLFRRPRTCIITWSSNSPRRLASWR
jgi:argininosuccinate lyase